MMSVRSSGTRKTLTMSLSPIHEGQADDNTSPHFIDTPRAYQEYHHSFDFDTFNAAHVIRLEARFDAAVGKTGLSHKEYVHEAMQNKLLPRLLYCNDKHAVLSTLKELAHLCETASYYRMIVFYADGHAAIVRVMRKWQGFPDVQAEACRALMNGAMCTSFRDAARQSGSLESIVWAMTNYATELSVQFCGIGALSNMCFSKRNADRLVSIDGVDAIIAAMRTFPSSLSVQQWACVTLDKLSEWDDFYYALNDAGAVEALRSAIWYAKESHIEMESVLYICARRAIARLMA